MDFPDRKSPACDKKTADFKKLRSSSTEQILIPTLSTDQWKPPVRRRKGGLRLQGSQSYRSTKGDPASSNPQCSSHSQAEMKFSKDSDVSKCLCKATDTILVSAR